MNHRIAFSIVAIALVAVVAYAGRTVAQSRIDAPLTCNVCPVEGAQTPYWRQIYLSLGPGAISGMVEEIAAPDGGRLVIEHVSAVVLVPKGQRMGISVRLTRPAPSPFIESSLPLTYSLTVGPTKANVYVSNHPVRIQVPAGALIAVHGVRTEDTSDAVATVNIAGYTVSAP